MFRVSLAPDSGNAARCVSRAAMVAAVALAAAAPAARAVLVNNGLGGNVEYDGWDVLTSAALTVGDLTSGFGSNEAGSGNAVLTRTAGGHFPATVSLYSFISPSDFDLSDTSGLSDVQTVVFTIQTWPNPDDGDGSDASGSISSGPALNFNGMSQALPADYTGVEYVGPGSFAGFDIDLYNYTFQWDLSSIGDVIDSYDVDWQQIVHSGVAGLQLESADAFAISSAVAVPEAGATVMCLLGASLAGVAAVVRRRRHIQSTTA